MIRVRTAFLGLFILAAALLLPTGSARADLAITPVRVVFQARDRSATVTLLNITNETHVYRIGWIMMQATPEGGYKMLPPDDGKNPYSVPNMVIYSPRQVTIEPHAYQNIRLSLRRPADLPPGEYRAHMSMTRLAQAPMRPQDDPKKKGQEIAINVNLGFSIPIIVRSGEDKDLKVSLANPKLSMGHQTPPAPTLFIDIHRDAGKFSTFGTVKVFWQPPKGPEKEIGMQDNVALYPELTVRHLDIALKDNPSSGSVRVTYTGKYESDGQKWAETSFPIGK